MATSANAQFYSPNIASLPAPQTKADWAYVVLLSLGIDPTKNPNSVADLIAQQNAEGTTGNLWNNPLAVTGPVLSGAKKENGDGVLSFATWQDGATANAIFMTQNDPQMVKALAANDPLKTYASVVSGSDWEALGGATNALNVNYGKSVGNDGSNGGGFSAAYAKLSPSLVQAFNAASLAATGPNGQVQP